MVHGLSCSIDALGKLKMSCMLLTIFLATCNANFGEKVISGSCSILECKAISCRILQCIIIFQTRSITGCDFSWNLQLTKPALRSKFKKND